MAQVFNNAVVTDAGVNLIAACEAAGDPIVFTRVVTGDGVHTDKTPAALKVRTALIDQKQSVSLSSKRAVTNACKITAVISNATLVTGYYMNELGLYAQQGSDSSTEVLFNIAVVAASQGDWFPPYNGTSPAEIVQSFVISSANDLNVQIALESDSFALKAELGDLDDLTTTDKDNVVKAINEVKDEVRPISKGGTGKNNADDACDNLGAVRRSIYANVHDESPLDDDVYGGDYIIHDGKMYFASQGKIPAGSTLNPHPGAGKNCDRVYADQELSEKASYMAITKNWEREFKCAMSVSGYDVDDLVYIWCAKKIYKVTASIDYGESMVVNTNIKEWSVEDETRELSSDLTPKTVSTLSPTSNISSSSTLRCYTLGKLCTIQMSMNVNSSLAANAKLFTGAPVPYGSNTVYTTLNGVGKSLPLAMNANGECYVDGTAGSNSGWMDGSFVYIMA